MKHYRRRSPIVEAVLWTGDNIEEVQELCSEAVIDEVGRLWIPAFINMYCVPGPAFIAKEHNKHAEKYSARDYYYRAYKPCEFNSIYEPTSDCQ